MVGRISVCRGGLGSIVGIGYELDVMSLCRYTCLFLLFNSCSIAIGVLCGICDCVQYSTLSPCMHLYSNDQRDFLGISLIITIDI